MVDKTTPRLGLPVPYLTNPLKIDVGKLTDALTMLDKNAVMLTDWDITSDSWQKMGKISNLAQGKIAITLMVVTGTGFANIVMQTGDGSVTTVGDPARITVTAQTNLGANSATILGGKLVEVAADTYEIWFNIAPSTAPRKWTGLLIAGNGATIDWTHSSGAQPTGGVALNIARSLTDQEVASPTITRDGAVLTAGYAGLMGIKLPYFDFAATGDTIPSHIWRVGETMRVKAADATTANGFPATITGAGATAWRIHCEGINEDRSSTVFIFASEGATPTWVYRITRTTTNWSAPRRMYTSDNPPAASETKSVAQMDNISTIINLNDRILPAHYGVVSLTSAAGAVSANNFPFDEIGQLAVFPIGVSGGVTQVYLAKSGRIASRSYDGSVFTDWRKSANSGVNDDITSMTGLSGPLKLGGDAAGDYDAVTLRQLKASTGTGGANMNGVVNNFIGSVDWFNGSRALMPAGYIPADGGVYSRAAYPELWNAISKGILANVSEADWQAGVSTGSGATMKTSAWAHRGKYSTGGAAGTAPAGSGVTDAWFRAPDLNGAQAGSISGLFLRGSGNPSQAQSVSVGTVAKDSLPNITGTTIAGSAGSYAQFFLNTTNGVFLADNTVYPNGTGDAIGTTKPGDAGSTRKNTLNFDASRSNGIYNLTNQYLDQAGVARDWTAAEVKPPQAVGIWIIRASGSFQAANTNFSVIAGDTALPSNNTSIKGGQIISDYQVAGVSECTASLQAVGTVASNYSARLNITNKTRGTSVNFDFSDDGGCNIPGALTVRGSITALSNIVAGGNVYANGGSLISIGQGGNSSSFVVFRDTANTKNMGRLYSERLGDMTISTSVNGSDTTQKYFQFLQAGNAVCSGGWSTTSDERIKAKIKRVDNALREVYGWRGATWEQDVNGKSFGIGLIAQDVEKSCPEAVTVIPEVTQSTGKVIKDVRTINAGNIAAAYHTEAIRTLVDLLALALDNPDAAREQLAALKA